MLPDSFKNQLSPFRQSWTIVIFQNAVGKKINYAKPKIGEEFAIYFLGQGTKVGFTIKSIFNLLPPLGLFRSIFQT